ncbi:hypothetical protein PCANC_28938 [Puccinia coronata f. sp. avenae]|uniref:Uncharacterized protein n=1 Tax=Puccinia coronata f. sp. avenae TaxID=200324 RepID=A0A2N5RWA0_9BASI|nr:hypothetical protein PCANC_28938 [Puccinia coronata f. sp. avenae]
MKWHLCVSGIRNHPPLIPKPDLKAFAIWGLNAGNLPPIPAKRLVVSERLFGILCHKRKRNATLDKVKACWEQELATIMFTPCMSLMLASRPSCRMRTLGASDSSGGSLSDS